jgi:hypothetical protein
MPERIDVVGIITRDRVPGMVACLESYVQNCRRFGRHPEFVVLDDSRDANVQAEARWALERMAWQTNAAIRYAAEPEKNRFARRLAAESSVPPDLIHFALFGEAHCGTTVGANRNALLLDTTGELVFSADDDTLCRIAATPAADDVVTQFSEYDPTELWFFPHRDAALQSVAFVDLDLLSSHESLLGGAVAVTLHGLAGDSGMASPRYYLTLGGASRERLTSSLETYRSRFEAARL